MKTLLFIFCLVTCLACALSANKQPVSVKMDCRREFSAVACSFMYTNNAKEDLYLLKSETPIEGLFSPFIDVSLHGSEPIPYRGIVAYRLPPTKDDFVLLKAGERYFASVEITDVFNIDTDGLYIIRYSQPLQYLTNLQSIDELKESTVDESVYITLKDTHLLVKPKEPEEPKIENIIHIQGCSSCNFIGGDRDNEDTLRVHKRLCSQIDVAKGRVGSSDALYKKWFGAYTAARGTKVTEVYDKMKTGISGHTVTYHNSGPACKGWVAYTYLTRRPYYTVYFCNYYFTQPDNCNGVRYTKERTLIHEWAHALGKARDYKYYARGCEAYAKTNPDNAVKNADSFSFHYCETY